MWVKGHLVQTPHGHQGADALVSENLEGFLTFLF